MSNKFDPNCRECGRIQGLVNVRRYQTGQRAAATQRKIEAMYREHPGHPPINSTQFNDPEEVPSQGGETSAGG